MKLAAPQKAALLAQADAVDVATAAYKELAEAKARAEEIGKAAAALDIEWLRLMGNDAEADLKELEARHADLKDKLEKEIAAGGAGAAFARDLQVRVQAVIDLTLDKQSVDRMSAEIERIGTQFSQRTSTIGTNREVGIMTDVEAQEALLAANLEQAQQLRALLPDLERMARLPGAMGEAARAMLVDLNNQIKVLENTTTLFEATLKNGVSEGLNKAISGLVDGTMSLREAIHELANTIFKSLLDMYAKNLTQYLMGPEGLGGLMGGFMDAANQGANGAGGLLAALFGNGVGAAGGAATAVADTAKLAQEQAVIAQEMAAAATLTTAGTTLSVSGTALSAAASALSAAAATMSASSGSSALGSAASAIGGMVMASSGGYTGPGGKFEPAGIVHRGEFVTRKAVTEQPGALAFLSDFNRVGMRAVEAWRKRYRARGFAEGGYVPAAPSVSSPLRALAASWNPVSATAGNTSVDNRIALNLFDDPARIAEVIRSPAGEKAFTVLLSRNPQKFRQLLGV